MKKRMMVALLAIAGLASGGAQAQTSGNFDVVINLTSACTLSTITNVTFNYTSNQVAAANSTGGGFNVACTNTLPYTMALDTTNLTDPTVNLSYTLALSAAGGTGSGANQPYTVNGTMAGGQGGTCGSASCDNTATGALRTRTLTVSW